METKHTHFRDNIFFYIIISLIVLVGIVSYYRFMINGDYIVSYEGVCDPSTESCFIGCEDDECTSEYYYSEVQKYAPDLYKECGKDITDCEMANICLPDDRECSVTYCDETIDDTVICSTFTEKQDIQENDQLDPATEQPLQNNNIDDTKI